MAQDRSNPTPLSTLWLTSFFVKPQICEAQKLQIDESDILFSNFSSMYNTLLSSYMEDPLVRALLTNTITLQGLHLSDILAQICYKKAKMSSFGYHLNLEELNDILKILSLLPLPNLSNQKEYENSVSNLIETYQNEKLLEKTPLLTSDEFEKCRLGIAPITESLSRLYQIEQSRIQNPKQQDTTLSIFFRLSLPIEFERVLDDVLTIVVYTYCMMKNNLAKKQAYFELPSSYLKKCLTIYTQHSNTLTTFKNLIHDKKVLLEQTKAEMNNPSFDIQKHQIQIDVLNKEISRLSVVLDGHRKDYEYIFKVYVKSYNSVQNVKKIYEYLEKSSKILKHLSIDSSQTTASLQGLRFRTNQYTRLQLGAFGLSTQGFDFFAELDARIQDLIGITDQLDKVELPTKISTEIKQQLQELKANPLEILDAGKCEKPIVDTDTMNLKKLLVGSLAAFGISILYGMSVRSRRKQNRKV